MKEYIKFLYTNYPDIVEDMRECSHHYSITNLSSYHLEGDVFSHTLMVAKLSELLGTHKNVQLAALLHDIGKPDTREVDHDKKKTMFYGHAGVSFWKSIEILNKLKCSDKDKIEILSLISLHLDFMNIKNNEGRIRHKFKNNQELLIKLAKLYYCDSNGRYSDDEHATREEINTIINTRVINEGSDKRGSTLTLLCGLPCSGKSTYIKESATRNDVILNRDSIVIEVAGTDNFNDAWAKVDQEKVNLLLEERFIKAVHERKNIIVDMTNMSRKRRNKFTCRVPQKDYNKKCIIFATELSEIKRRNIKRNEETNKLIPNKVYSDMMRGFSLPMYDDFDNIDWRF